LESVRFLADQYPEAVLAEYRDGHGGVVLHAVVAGGYPTPDAVRVRMDVPGVKPADLDLQIHGNLLTITGKREEEKEEKDRTYHRVERSSGSFSRTVTLPCAVDEAKVEAQYKDGILTVALPKTPEAKAHKIQVKA